MVRATSSIGSWNIVVDMVVKLTFIKQWINKDCEIHPINITFRFRQNMQVFVRLVNGEVTYRHLVYSRCTNLFLKHFIFETSRCTNHFSTLFTLLHQKTKNFMHSNGIPKSDHGIRKKMKYYFLICLIL